MSTEFFNDQWRIPSNENQNKISNYSCEFDGTNQGINLGSNFPYPSTVTDPWSVSFWIKRNETNSSGYIFSTYEASSATGIFVSIRGSNTAGAIQALVRGSTSGQYSAVKTNNATLLNGWTHVVAVYNGNPVSSNSGFTIYFNSSSKALTPFGSPGQTGSLINSSDKYIGQREDNSSYLTNCELDQVTFFDYELSASQVSTLYGGGTAITNPMSLSPKPIAYYQLGDQSVDNGANLLVPNNSLSDYVFNFDGTNDYINNDYINAGSASYLNGLSQFSISVWFNLHTAADAKCIISDWNFNTSPFGHFSLRTIDTSGTDYALILYIKKDLSDAGSNAVKTSVIFTENTWYNAVFTYNSFWNNYLLY
jgi:hypothetical protein